MSNATLEARVADLESRVAHLEQQIAGARKSIERVSKEMSVKEFILTKSPSNDVERTLAIAYFLERFCGMSSFNVEDLARQFQLAKEAVPANINDKVNMNVRKGHMAEAREKKDSKKAWLVTNSGEKYVESGFKD